MNLFGLHELGKVYRREENRERKGRIRGDEKEILWIYKPLTDNKLYGDLLLRRDNVFTFPGCFIGQIISYIHMLRFC